jgi:hypothetical protein
LVVDRMPFRVQFMCPFAVAVDSNLVFVWIGGHTAALTMYRPRFEVSECHY